MNQRFLLPQRRRAETFTMQFGGQNAPFVVTVGFYADDHPGEVFITGAKSGSDMAATLHDGAVLLSLAMQYGVPLETLKGTVGRNLDGSPATVIGAVIDRLTNWYGV